MLALVLLILYLFIIRSGLPLMFQATVYARGFAVVVFLLLAFTTGPWQLAIFAAVDAAGATWTHVTNPHTA